jgi:hypothetical protein
MPAHSSSHLQAPLRGSSRERPLAESDRSVRGRAVEHSLCRSPCCVSRPSSRTSGHTVPTVTTPSPTPTIPVVVVDGPGAYAWEVVAAVFGVVGVLAAIAFAISGAAQVRRERRIIHELDVLRDLAELAPEVGRGIYRVTRIRVPLLTLRDADACPVLRAFADANPTPDGLRKLDRLLDRPYPYNEQPALAAQAAWAEIEDECLQEIEAATRARLDEESRLSRFRERWRTRSHPVEQSAHR